MEYQSGTKTRTTLRLADSDTGQAWERDPALDDADLGALDELADLFIGESEHAPGAEPEDGAHDAPSLEEAPIEAIITGHLPVRGAVWVRSYAARVAEQTRAPVALVRVTPDHTAVELVGSSAREAQPVTSVATAIQAAGCAARRWLLHFDELDQASLLQTGFLDAVTVLSGSDEPAIVAAYRLIKSIVEDGDPADRIGVSIVGADDANAARAAKRLVGATRQFLGFTLDVQPGVPRVRAASSALLGEVDARHDPLQILSLIVDQPSGSDRGRPSDTGPGEPGTPAAPTDTEVRAAPAPDTAEPVDPHADRPALARLVDGLRPLDLPCPVAPAVELAMDEAGRLHLLSWWSPEAPAHLLRASAWAGVNMPLLERVCEGLTAHAAAPAQHIVCEDLAVAADLLGTGTTVHLIQCVERAPADGWMCARVS